MAGISKKQALIKKLFKEIFGAMISAEYQKLSKEEIISVAAKTISLFDKKF